MVGSFADCCARAASGQAAAAPPSSVMNSRRFKRSNCIKSPTRQNRIVVYRIGEDQSGGIGAKIYNPPAVGEAGSMSELGPSNKKFLFHHFEGVQLNAYSKCVPFFSKAGGRSLRTARHQDHQLALFALFGDCRLGCGDFRLHGIEVEAGALLHRRKLDRSHGQLLYLLLDKHEAPEFVLEPVEVLLCPGLSPTVGPARALEGIEAKVGNIGHIRLGFVAQPTTGLIDETKLVVIDAHGTQLTFAEVPD